MWGLGNQGNGVRVGRKHAVCMHGKEGQETRRARDGSEKVGRVRKLVDTERVRGKG